MIYNVASGRAVTIRELILTLATMTGIDVQIDVDATLVRPEDAPEVRGDASRIAHDVGWRPCISLDETLRDVLAEVSARPRPMLPKPLAPGHLDREHGHQPTSSGSDG
jgi:GDP-4-dehydro-6-deoxy-D-mannose reductase